MRLPRCFALTALAVTLLSNAAAAQDYPTRPVTIVVPFAPGGGTDILARMLGQRLEQRLGKTFVVENRPGAGSIIAASAVAKAAPDGYTLMMAPSPTMAVNVTLYKNLPYNPVADLIPLALVVQSPFVLVVNPQLPVHSVKELVAYAKENPGKLSFASVGPGVPHHLFAELFKSMTGIAMTHVPYKGSLPALNDVVAGHIPLMFTDLGPAVGMLQAGQIRPLGVSTRTRLAAFADIPPIADSVPGFDAASWQMIVAPAATPQPIVGRLHEELDGILALPEIKERIVKLGFVPIENRSVDGLQAFVKAEIGRWGKVVQQAGLAGSQ
jgi:tripartite-type tricarboxylate transporter receptor subunit TctC